MRLFVNFILFLCLISFNAIAASCAIPKGKVLDIRGSGDRYLKECAQKVFNDNRYRDGIIKSGSYGCVVIPKDAKKGDFVLKFSSQSEMRRYNRIARRLKQKPASGYRINVPQAYHRPKRSVYLKKGRDICEILKLPYAYQERVAWESIQKVVNGSKNADCLADITAIGKALGSFQRQHYRNGWVYAHYDFHAKNLVIQPTKTQGRKVVFIDAASIGVNNRASMHVDPLYFMIYELRRSVANRYSAFRGKQNGIQEFMKAFYKGYLEALPQSARRRLKRDYVGFRAYDIGENPEFMVNESCWEPLMVRAMNRVVQEELKKYIKPASKKAHRVRRRR